MGKQPIQKNDRKNKYNALDELLSCSHDLNGNVTSHDTLKLKYDPLNQLIAATKDDLKIEFTYDPLGRRLSKTSENYLYDGEDEIAALSLDGKVKQARIMGITPIAIELDGNIYAPISDAQGNIRQLIDASTKRLEQTCTLTAFGEHLQQHQLFNPWCYAGKRLDPELNLVYFGKRMYSPELGRWVTLDPAGFLDSNNLYQYVFNNPLSYTDPDGQLVFAIPLIAIAFGVETTLTFATASAAAGLLIAWGVDTYRRHIEDRAYRNSFRHVNSSTVEAEKKAKEKEKEKKGQHYFPDRPLPQTQDGIPIPDSKNPHTQLGTREGRKEKYGKAREFDEHGNVVRDIEFTDHGRHDHPNPHQHRREPNKSGGTRTREDPEPVPEWRY